MGQWTLMSARLGWVKERNDLYGHNFGVVFKLKYTKSLIGSFTEMPQLEWKETITMIEQRAGTWWQFIDDQYNRLPSSPTFLNWVNRYKNAFLYVRESPPDTEFNWTARFYDANGNKLKRDDFPRLNTDKEKADYVRTYLQKNGGIMEINAMDTPAISKNSVTALTHKNRILTFDCGLRGSSMRTKLYQHLIVDGSKGLDGSGWYRKFEESSISPPFQTAGLRKIEPPTDVTKSGGFTGGPAQGTYR